MSTEMYRTESLRAAGYGYEDVRQLVRDGALDRLRRGAYLAGGWRGDAVERHRLAVRAAAVELSPDAVISHVSAAVLHGIPTWRTPLSRVHATRNRRSGGRRTSNVHIHVARLDRDEVTSVDGIAVTTVTRTVVDLARTVQVEQGVVAADGALAAGLTDGGQLDDALRRMGRRRGAPTARLVVGFADGRAESVGESRSRVAIAQVGLPAPELQWEVRDHGRLLGRTDFAWPARGVVGEFDGRIKYGRLQAADEAVYQEKLREDTLRLVVRAVVRWGWDDLDDFGAAAARIHRALG